MVGGTSGGSEGLSLVVMHVGAPHEEGELDSYCLDGAFFCFFAIYQCLA